MIEDVHWADEALLAFVEHLAQWSEDVPLLLVCTTRPELLESRPTWGSGSVRGTTIRLSRLSDAETAQLISALLDRVVLPADTQRAILDRAGGNPLYAEEFVRMLRDRDLLDGRGNLRDGVDVPLPDSVQALIAARLDSLSPEHKALLQMASVVGKVFSAQAVAGLLDRPTESLEESLHALARKDFLRAHRRPGQQAIEYSFWHVLIRDVAYASLPRAGRARLHASLVSWIESQASDRVEDVAEILAHHATEALTLAEATGDLPLATAMRSAAARYTLLAGERAVGLDAPAAARNLAAALALTPTDAPERLHVRALYGSALFDVGRFGEACEALQPVVDAAAVDVSLLADIVVAHGVIDQGNAVMLSGGSGPRPEARSSSRPWTPCPDGPSRVLAMAYLANEDILQGHEEGLRRGIRRAESAKTLATSLGLGPAFGTSDSLASAVSAFGRAILGDRAARQEAPARISKPSSSSAEPTWSTAWAGSSGPTVRGPARRLSSPRARTRRAFARERGLDFVLADESRAEILIPLGRLEDARRGAQRSRRPRCPAAALRAGSPLGRARARSRPRHPRRARPRPGRQSRRCPEVPAVCAVQLARLELSPRAAGIEALAAAAGIDDLVLARSRAFTAYLPPLGRLLAGLDLVDRLEGLTAASSRRHAQRDQHTRTTLEALLAQTQSRHQEAVERFGAVAVRGRTSPTGWSTPTRSSELAGAWSRSGTPARPRPCSRLATCSTRWVAGPGQPSASDLLETLTDASPPTEQSLPAVADLRGPPGGRTATVRRAWRRPRLRCRT